MELAPLERASRQRNDHQLIAGAASAVEPVFITMLRVSSPPDNTITTADLVDALTWALDHQQERGGPGPINVSINMAPPNTFNTFSVFQGLAQSLQAQGDLIVNGADNTLAEDSSPNNPGIRRVAGTDETTISGVCRPMGLLSPPLHPLRTYWSSGRPLAASVAPQSCLCERYITVDSVLV